MFQSKQDYEKAEFKTLINIKNGKYYPQDFDFQIGDDDYNQIITELLYKDAIIGFTLIKTLGGSGYKAMEPRILLFGYSVIEVFVLNKILMPLVRLAESKGLENAYFTSTDIEEKLGISLLDAYNVVYPLETNDFATIESKLYASDEIYFFVVKLTARGFNAHSDMPSYREKEKEQATTITNNYTNSTVIHGDVTISDSFKQEIKNSQDIPAEFKQELIDLIHELRTEIKESNKVTEKGKSAITTFISKMGGKASETVVSQCITMLIQGIVNKNP